MPNLWNFLSEPFDEKLPRRTAIAVKHDKWGLAFAYPSDFGKIGYLLDTDVVTDYKENSAISMSFAEYSSRDYPGSLEKNTFIFADMRYRPSMVSRKIEFTNVGIKADETFCQTQDGGFAWDICCNYLNNPNTPLKRRVFSIFTVADDECVVKVAEDTVEIEYSSKGEKANKLGICSNFERAAVYSSMDRFIESASMGELGGGDGHGKYIVFQHCLDSTKEEQTNIRFGISLNDQEHAKKAYKQDALEQMVADEWNQWLNMLPKLNTEDSDELKAYYKCWSVVRANYYKHPELGNTVIESLPVYRGYWQWSQTAMETISSLDPELPGFFKALIDLFLKYQRQDGYVTHAIYFDEKIPGERWSARNIIQTPHIPWLVMRYYYSTGDLDSLKRWYEPLRRYYDYLCDSRDNHFRNLHLWAVLASYDTGLDTTPPLERVTYGEDGIKESYCYPAIFSAERAKYEHAMSEMAEALGKGEQDYWLDESKKTIDSLNKHLWDSSKKWFGVIHEDGSLDTRVGVDGLFPLAYGLVDQDRAELARENFMRLMGKYGVRTTAEGEKGYRPFNYWRGPVWPKSLSMAGEAAVNYYSDLIDEIRESTIRFCLHYPSIWECMNADTGEICRGDSGTSATPLMSSNVGAGELIGLLRLLRNQR